MTTYAATGSGRMLHAVSTGSIYAVTQCGKEYAHTYDARAAYQLLASRIFNGMCARCARYHAAPTYADAHPVASELVDATDAPAESAPILQLGAKCTHSASDRFHTPECCTCPRDTRAHAAECPANAGSLSPELMAQAFTTDEDTVNAHFGITPDAPRLTLNTTQLALGDVVHVHGMRILLDTAPNIYTDRDSTVYAWIGTVQNVEEVRADRIVPISWLRFDGIGQEYPEGVYRWNVQGNDFARWNVERA